MSILPGRDIGIDHFEFYVPEEAYPVEATLRLESGDFSQQRMESIWRDFWFEPDVLYQYFTRQIAGGGQSAALTEAGWAKLMLSSGIERVHCAATETASDMAIRVGQQILGREPDLASRVDVAIYYHATLDQMLMGSVSCRLQHELGLRNAFAFAVAEKSGNAGLMALKVACDMLTAEDELNTILVIGSDKYIAPYRRGFEEMTVLGDSAGAMLVRRGGKQCRPSAFSIQDLPGPWNANDGEAVLSKLVDSAGHLLDHTLAELELSWSDVALLLPPNFNLSFSRALGQKLRLPPGKVYTRNISRYGCLASSDLVVNLASVFAEGGLSRGDRFVALSLGIDNSIGCAVFCA